MTTWRAMIHKYRALVIQCLVIIIFGISATILFEYHTVTEKHGLQTADVENNAFSRFSQRNIAGERQDYRAPDESNDMPRNEYGRSQKSSDAFGKQRGHKLRSPGNMKQFKAVKDFDTPDQSNDMPRNEYGISKAINNALGPGNMDKIKAVLRAKGVTDRQIDLLIVKMAQGDTDLVRNILKAKGISEDQLSKFWFFQPEQIDDKNPTAYLEQLLLQRGVPEHVLNDIMRHFAEGHADIVEHTLKHIRVPQEKIDLILRMGSTGNSDNGNNVETEKRSGIQSAIIPTNDDSIHQATGNDDFRDLKIFLKQKGAPDGLVDDITKHMAQGDTAYVENILKRMRVDQEQIDQIIKMGSTGNSDNGNNVETEKQSGIQSAMIPIRDDSIHQATGNDDDFRDLKIFLKQKGAPNDLVDDITKHMAQGDTAYVEQILKAKRVSDDIIDEVIKLGNPAYYRQHIIETKKTEYGDQAGFVQQQAEEDTDSEYLELKHFLKGKGASDGLVDDITKHLEQGDTAFVINLLEAKRVPAYMIDEVIKLYRKDYDRLWIDHHQKEEIIG